MSEPTSATAPELPLPSSLKGLDRDAAMDVEITCSPDKSESDGTIGDDDDREESELTCLQERAPPPTAKFGGDCSS